MENKECNCLRIDVAAVLRAKMPRYHRLIPRFILSWLKETVCEDSLNQLLQRNAGKTGTDFAKAMIDEFGVEVKVIGYENLPENGKYIFVSNHPLGGLDGMALIALLGNKYHGKLRFIVNDLLMAVEPLKEIFVPVNKVGRQSRERAEAMRNAYESDCQIATFPAGLCSRNTHGDVIEDLQWQKAFVDKAVEYGRDVVPIYFEGRNSSFFYRLSKIRRQLGVKFNIEMVYLPKEMFKSRGKVFTVIIGKPISHTVFDNSRSKKEWAEYVRTIVYGMHDQQPT